MRRIGCGLAIVAIGLGLWWGVRERALAARLEIDAELRHIIAAGDLGPLNPPPAPDPALFALGEALFYDKELSGNRDISCATCHHPSLASGDALPISIGTGGHGLGATRQRADGRDFVARNATELFNRGVGAWTTMFWDGRVAATTDGILSPAGAYLPDGLDSALAAQAMFPITFRTEMRGGWYDVAGYTVQPGDTFDEDYAAQSPWHDTDIYGQTNELAVIPNGEAYFPEVWGAALERLLTLPDYQTLFAAAYPDLAPEALGFEHAARALAVYQAAAFTTLDSPWDRYLAGEKAALSDEAAAGARLFYGAANCSACHSGPLLTDQAFHNLAVPQLGPGTAEDAPLDYGRFDATRDPTDRFAFRTPPLRNVTLTGPWMHNGAFDSLRAVVDHHLSPAESLAVYDGAHLPDDLRASLQNAPVTQRALLDNLDSRLAPERALSLKEIGQLLAFLEALTDPAAADMSHLVPARVPSGLPVGD